MNILIIYLTMTFLRALVKFKFKFKFKFCALLTLILTLFMCEIYSSDYVQSFERVAVFHNHVTYGHLGVTIDFDGYLKFPTEISNPA